MDERIIQQLTRIARELREEAERTGNDSWRYDAEWIEAARRALSSQQPDT